MQCPSGHAELISIEDANRLSRLLDQQGVAHSLLTAEDHDQEAQVIAQAGRQGAVTLVCATAGRGVDPTLGGNAEYWAEQALRAAGMTPDADPAAWHRARLEAISGHSLEIVAGHDTVAALGGLCVIGIGRHESQRLDDLRRGWAGRRGDPGESRAYLSVEELTQDPSQADELMRLISSVPLQDGTESSSFTWNCDQAQRVLEQHTTQRRVLSYRFAAIDDVHRLLVYAQRRGVLERTRLEENVQEMIDEVITSYIEMAAAEKGRRRRELRKALARLYPISPPVSDFVGDSGGLPAQLISDRVQADAHAAYSRREQELTSGVMREFEQQVLLNVIDSKWREHLTRTSALRDKIWRSDLDTATQLAEYQRQSRELLDRMIADVKQEAVGCLFNLDVEVT